MLTSTYAFSGLGVSDLTAAKHFYGGQLGLELEEDMGGLRMQLPGGQSLFVYYSPAFSAAGYTVLNFQVPDIDAAVQELTDAGIQLERYEGMQFDELGISRGKATSQGPDIAWFRDPAGNVLSVLEP
ncbi:VOC family protein [Gryllotalpicola reticulitermitis]|uniref:VOC family protein n=1 Tax=Gryllotalpicola reticulitermitis TaxID=1184153 RepID=A0ABV8Q7K5_9MICO